MKYLMMLAVVFLLASCSEGPAEGVGNKTTMEVNGVFDGGKVMKGEMITAKFEVKNTGTFPLVISEVKGSCTCTVADYPQEPISPGETGTIMAHVNTDRTNSGLIKKSVNIVANTDPSVTQVLIKANVVRK